ncbi:MAG: hypothetical protein AAF694_04190 [Bacteroidota bacterium]
MSEKTSYVNAFYILLLQKIIVISFDLLDKDGFERKIRDKDFVEIAGILELDAGTLKKFFNASSNKNKPSFHTGILNTLISNLDSFEETDWSSFTMNNKPSTEIIRRNQFIPIAHLEQLSEKWKVDIGKAVALVLKKLFPDKDLSQLNLGPVEIDVQPNPLGKLQDNYLDTTWYVYFISAESRFPKIGRTVLRIGDSPEKVTTESIKSGGFNDYEGTIEFDKNESYLILNLKSIGTSERWVHVKVDVSTGGRPEIALGQYQNIGLAGRSLIFSNVVFEYINPDNEISISPIIVDAGDPQFSEVPLSIQKYLQNVDRNYSEPPSKIYSIQALDDHLEKDIFIKRDRERKIKIHSSLRFVISFPKYSIPEEVFYERYEGPTNELISFFTEKGFEVLLKEKDEPRSKPPVAQYHKFFSDRIKACDIFIMLYFDRAPSNSLIELGLALELGKEIFIYADEVETLPYTVQDPNLPYVRFRKFKDPASAVDFIMDNYELLFKDFIL